MKLVMLNSQNVMLNNKRLQKNVPIGDVFRSNNTIREEVNLVLRISDTKDIFKKFEPFGIKPLNPGFDKR